MSDFSPEKKNIEVSPGEAVRILRELQGLSQGELQVGAEALLQVAAGEGSFADTVSSVAQS